MQPESSAAVTQAAATEENLEWILRVEPQRLFGIAVTILRDPGEAEDAVQEALTLAWSRRAMLRDPAAARSWLTRICINHCISRRRRLLRMPLLFGAVRDRAPPPWLFEGRRLELDRAFATLTVRQRTATVLFYHHGYSIAECAAVMACAPGSVRSHLGRSLVKLRKEMTNA
jgi:RNA polymerase sigma-70 factor (ECF subfamily)